MFYIIAMVLLAVIAIGLAYRVMALEEEVESLEEVIRCLVQDKAKIHFQKLEDDVRDKLNDDMF